MATSFLSPKIFTHEIAAKSGLGIYAAGPISGGERLLVWGGKVYTGEELYSVPPELRRYFVQVEEDLYLGSPDDPEPADYVNHSCDPNAGFFGQIVLVAMRDIRPGEEICIDYAMCDSTPYDEFKCGCGTALCRRQITGNDWQLPELQQRYAGFFVPYLQKRIDQQHAGMKTGRVVGP